MLEQLRSHCLICDDYAEIKSFFESICDSLMPAESGEYKAIFSSVLGDFLEAVPHTRLGLLTEDDLYFNAYNPHICEVCGDVIEPGESAFFRTDPCPAIRHKKCSRNVRSSHEYAYIGHMVKEIEYHEQVFRFEECRNYKLFESPGISLQWHRRYGYSIERDGSVTGIPFLGEFILDFISGVEDYDLIVRYRPYHLYIEYMLRAIGVDEETIRSLGGCKFLLREAICRQRHPSVVERIDNISMSDLMFDKHIHKLVSSEIVNIIYVAAFKRIFRSMGILADDDMIILNGIPQSYSVNDCSIEADISIIVDREDIYCVDFEKSVPFTEYFDHLTDDVRKLLNYCRQFGVDI